MYQLLRITHDGREEEMEENMQLVNTMIGIQYSHKAFDTIQ